MDGRADHFAQIPTQSRYENSGTGSAHRDRVGALVGSKNVGRVRMANGRVTVLQCVGGMPGSDQWSVCSIQIDGCRHCSGCMSRLQ